MSLYGYQVPEDRSDRDLATHERSNESGVLSGCRHRRAPPSSKAGLTPCQPFPGHCSAERNWFRDASQWCVVASKRPEVTLSATCPLRVLLGGGTEVAANLTLVGNPVSGAPQVPRLASAGDCSALASPRERTKSKRLARQIINAPPATGAAIEQAFSRLVADRGTWAGSATPASYR